MRNRSLRLLGRATTGLRQQGAALLAAMLTVTLVASFAAAATWQQWRAIEVETAERARVQAGWILVGALDWSRLILREDARSSGIVDHLAEPWSVPLQEARMSSFLAADKNNTALSPGEDTLELFLSGQIVDMQSRLNVLNLVDAGRVSTTTMASFGKLFDLLDINPAQLQTLAENLRYASDTSAENLSGAQAPLLPQRVEQLVWLGLSPAALQQLEPFITLLPVYTAVNLNTAPAEVLYASIPGLELNMARRMVEKRSQQHFADIAQAQQFVPSLATQIILREHSVASQFFLVRGRLRMGDTVVQERSLVQRSGLDVKTLWRERASLPKLDAPASLQ
jgi:general secretion pathway protein K